MNLDSMQILYKVRKAQLLLGFFILIGLFSCETRQNEINITGFTMGTTYSIKIINNTGERIDSDELKTQVDSVLVSFNQQMSTYIKDSEISIFNTPAQKRVISHMPLPLKLTPFRLASASIFSAHSLLDQKGL